MNELVYEKRIKALKRDLYNSNLEITRLYKEREISEQEIALLKTQIKELQTRLQKLTRVTETRENYINHIETQAEEQIYSLEDEIAVLKNRITELAIKSNI